MKQIIKPKYQGQFLIHTFLEPWITMLLLGTLGHHLHVGPTSLLYQFGYWNTFIVLLAAQVAWPIMTPSIFTIEDA